MKDFEYVLLTWSSKGCISFYYFKGYIWIGLHYAIAFQLETITHLAHQRIHLRGFHIRAIVFAGGWWWLNSSKWIKSGIYSTLGLARIWLCSLDVFLVNKYLDFIFCYGEFWTFDVVIEPGSTSHNCNFCFLNWLALLKQNL